MKFRKKPVVIEAWQFNGEDAMKWPPWLHSYEAPNGAVCFWEELPISKARQLTIPTLEGAMLASVGDWIIRGVKGEVYPCKPDIFEMTYEPEKAPPPAG